MQRLKFPRLFWTPPPTKMYHIQPRFLYLIKFRIERCVNIKKLTFPWLFVFVSTWFWNNLNILKNEKFDNSLRVATYLGLFRRVWS